MAVFPKLHAEEMWNLRRDAVMVKGHKLGVRLGQRAWLQDDTWWPALGDLLHRFAFTRFLDGIHHLKRTEATFKSKQAPKWTNVELVTGHL